jgi:hypothetical protein
MSASSAKSIEDLKDSSTLLHGNNSELILLIDPDKEGFGFVVENSSSFWPVSVEVASSKESISLLEKEVVVNQLLLNIWVHSLEWVESTLQITIEGVTGLNNFIHDFVSLLSGDTWSKWVSSKVSSNSDSS